MWKREWPKTWEENTMRIRILLTVAFCLALTGASAAAPPDIKTQSEPIKVYLGDYARSLVELETGAAASCAWSLTEVSPRANRDLRAGQGVLAWDYVHVDPSTTLPALIDVKVKAENKDGSDEETYLFHVFPFDITRKLCDDCPKESRAYDSINLMAFMLDGMGQRAMYETLMGQMIAHLLDSHNPRGLEAAEAAGLRADFKGIRTGIADIQGGSGYAAIANTPIMDFFKYDLTSSRTDVHNGFLTVEQAGMNLPFLHIQRPIPDVDRKPFFEEYLAAVGHMTELDFFVTPRKYANPEALRLFTLAKERGVFRRAGGNEGDASQAGQTGSKQTRDQDKYNSYVCVSLFNGQSYEDECQLCSNPLRETWCSMAEPGVCSMSSDPAPCASYPPQQ